MMFRHRSLLVTDVLRRVIQMSINSGVYRNERLVAAVMCDKSARVEMSKRDDSVDHPADLEPWRCISAATRRHADDAQDCLSARILWRGVGRGRLGTGGPAARAGGACVSCTLILSDVSSRPMIVHLARLHRSLMRCCSGCPPSDLV